MWPKGHNQLPVYRNLDEKANAEDDSLPRFVADFHVVEAQDGHLVALEHELPVEPSRVPITRLDCTLANEDEVIVELLDSCRPGEG